MPALDPDGEMIAVLTPTTRPLESSKGPPELPGFTAASVWMTSEISQATLEGADHAGGQRLVEAVGIADRISELSDLKIS